MAGELDAATQRLASAVAVLETALARHFDVDARRSDLETELQVMQDDRARLAVELESATAQIGRAEGAADHAGRRVAAAIAVIRAVLAEDGEPAVPGEG